MDGWGLWCCILALGAAGAVPVAWTVGRMVLVFRRRSVVRTAVLAGLRRSFDPQGQGWVSGTADHALIRLADAIVEVRIVTTHQDATQAPNRAHSTLFSPIEAWGHATIRASWRGEHGPTFGMKSRSNRHQPSSLDDGFELTGEHAPLVRAWLEDGPLRGAAPVVFPWSARSDGRVVVIEGPWRKAPAEETLAARVRVAEAFVRAGATWSPTG